ncbi:hypothetical protein POM88_044234 [Heracleum sosnowskyi]|uniref:Uncharacterized protein n=1 Tax=Heracleum sosnowskyi TaxID=360622 RepID=A0AAD8M2P2_9APIA|nr:hypothetical protein POM88_044234 [Heracleum sosnowskyi]
MSLPDGTLLTTCCHALYSLNKYFLDQNRKQLAHLKGVLHDLYQEYAAEASRIKGITLESSQVSSSDNNIFMDDMETPAGMSEYEAFIRDSGAAVEPAKSELDEYLFEGLFVPSSAKAHMSLGSILVSHFVDGTFDVNF